jgi:hypothetical protein
MHKALDHDARAVALWTDLGKKMADFVNAPKVNHAP